MDYQPAVLQLSDYAEADGLATLRRAASWVALIGVSCHSENL